MRAVCIARHRFLSEHYATFFEALAVDGVSAVGFDEGMRLTRAGRPDIVLCDYDLLVAAPLAQWAADPVLADIPIVAVSLTRRQEEAMLTGKSGVVGYLYLPTLHADDARHILRAATAGRSSAVRPPADALRWPLEHPELQRLD
jgi:CheY-like chemotaxis protein